MDDFLTGDELDDKINPDIEPWEEADRWENDSEDFDPGDFLPEDIFGQNEPAGDEAEKEWEEEVNYLYPTEEEFVSLANQEILKNSAQDFNSIADILDGKKEKPGNWSIPAERQNFEEIN